MKGIRIRLEQEGLRAPLFDLEAEIMEVVWSAGWERFSVADVHARLLARRDIAYTTVMTTLARLVAKGLLERERQGRRHVYRARWDREAFFREVTRQVLDHLPVEASREAVALLVERVAAADPDELDRLEALIRARREELKR